MEYKDLYIGFECQKIDDTKTVEEYYKKMEIKLWWNKEYTPKTIWVDYTITERDMEFYKKNPLWLYQLKEKELN